MSDLHSLFLQVKKDLMERGWYQGSPGYGPDGSICLGRAITGSFGNYSPVRDVGLIYRAMELAKEATDSSYLPVWNDQPERTFEEVMDVVDQMILQTSPVEVELYA